MQPQTSGPHQRCKSTKVKTMVICSCLNGAYCATHTQCIYSTYMPHISCMSVSLDEYSRTCSVSQWRPRAMRPAEGQLVQPCMVSFRGSPTPRQSSNRVRRCSMTSSSPLEREAPPWALSVNTASSVWLASFAGQSPRLGKNTQG